MAVARAGWPGLVVCVDDVLAGRDDVVLGRVVLLDGARVVVGATAVVVVGEVVVVVDSGRGGTSSAVGSASNVATITDEGVVG